MAAGTSVPFASYLHTSYRPDREYIDGEIRERNVGKWQHAQIMVLLAGWFGNYEAEWSVDTAQSA